MTTFKDYDFPKSIHRALEEINFNEPTPVQKAVIPLLQAGKDLIATAQTGTGKTAAFCLPALAKLMANPKAKILVIAPTRELVQQTEAFWADITKYADRIRSVAITGGVSYHGQFRKMAKNPQAIFATPGRLLDHLQNKKLCLKDLEYLVFDEADRILDMGFSQEINKILRFIPKERQSLLFSATWDNRLDKIASTYLKDPEKINVGQVSQAAKSVKQEIVLTKSTDKKDKLVEEVTNRQGSILVFTRTKRLSDQLSKLLSIEGFQTASIHGDKSQGQRNRALKAFRDGQARIMVATDVASRGIDVQDIAHVINYNLPRESENYIHRIGRTGRAGAEGTALSLISPDEYALWHPIVGILKKSGSDLPEMPPQLMNSKGSSSGGGGNRRGSSGGGFRGRSRSGGSGGGGGRSTGGRSGSRNGGSRSSTGGRSGGSSSSSGQRSFGNSKSSGGGNRTRFSKAKSSGSGQRSRSR